MGTVRKVAIANVLEDEIREVRPRERNPQIHLITWLLNQQIAVTSSDGGSSVQVELAPFKIVTLLVYF